MGKKSVSDQMDEFSRRYGKMLPQMVRVQLNKMGEENTKAFAIEFTRRSKETFTAYLLWLCFGWHYAYAGKWGTQFLFWASWVFSLGVVGACWWLVDAFRVPGLIWDKNREIAISAMKDLKNVST